jgi:hypothetical protein
VGSDTCFVVVAPTRETIHFLSSLYQRVSAVQMKSLLS